MQPKINKSSEKKKDSCPCFEKEIVVTAKKRGTISNSAANFGGKETQQMLIAAILFYLLFNFFIEV